MFGASPISRNGTRDLRLDFIRGIALYMVLVDHVVGDPIGRFTYHVLGFSDAAEIFVFVSGVTGGIAYSKLISRSGWVSFLIAAAERAARIYLYYALTGLAIILLVTISHAELDATLSTLARDPVYASSFVLGMVYSPPVSGILLLYLPLTLIVMPLFFWGARRKPAATLAVSGTIWLISQLFPHFASVLTERTWLNPLAWQFLFVIGLFCGMRYSASAGQTLLKRAEWFVALAWLIVGVSFLYRFSLFISPRVGLDAEWFRLPATTVMYMKETLSPIRLLHFLSIALLFTTYVRPRNSLLQTFVAKPFVIAGQRSLEMFSVSVVLCMAANVYVLDANPSVTTRLIIDGVMASAMAMTAFLITRSDRKRSAPIGDQVSSGMNR